jgi:hypothetical protein
MGGLQEMCAGELIVSLVATHRSLTGGHLVQKAVKERGLDKLLQQATEENPLTEPPPHSPPPNVKA